MTPTVTVTVTVTLTHNTGMTTDLVLLYGEYVWRHMQEPVVELHTPLGYEQLFRHSLFSHTSP